MKRLLVMTAGVSATIGLANLPVWTAAAEDRRDPVPIEQLDWTGERVAMTHEAATRDSDGDGWSDWYERLEGTDPFDAASHPTSLSLEVVDGTVFVQSLAFPDRLVIVDLQLPESADAAGDLLASLDRLGVSGLEKLHDQMQQLTDGLAGDVVMSVLKEADAMLGTTSAPQFEQRVGGRAVSLISDVYVGRNSQGEHQVTITTPDGFAQVTSRHDGTTAVNDVDRSGLDDDGNGDVVTFKTVDGKVVSITVTSYDGHTPSKSVTWTPEQGFTTTSVAPTETKPTDTKPTDTKAPDTTAKPTDTTAKPTETTAKPTETTTGGYRDPDADVFVMPTATEVAARVAFLRGVNTTFGPRADIVLGPPKDRPGVADPDEPPCSDERCVVFVDLGAPDMSRTSGGCPPTYCTAAGPGQRP